MKNIKDKMKHRTFVMKHSMLPFIGLLIAIAIMACSTYFRGGLVFTQLRINDGIVSIFGSTSLSRALTFAFTLLFLAPPIIAIFPVHAILDMLRPKTGWCEKFEEIYKSLWCLQLLGYITTNYVLYLAEQNVPISKYELTGQYTAKIQAFLIMYFMLGILLFVSTAKLFKEFDGKEKGSNKLVVIEVPERINTKAYLCSDLAIKLSSMKRAANKKVAIVQKCIGNSNKSFSGDWLILEPSEDPNILIIEGSETRTKESKQLRVRDFIEELRKYEKIGRSALFVVDGSNQDLEEEIEIIENHKYVVIYIPATSL